MEKQLNSQESHLDEIKNLQDVHVLLDEQEQMILGGEGVEEPVGDDPNLPDSKWVFGKPGSG